MWELKKTDLGAASTAPPSWIGTAGGGGGRWTKQCGEGKSGWMNGARIYLFQLALHNFLFLTLPKDRAKEELS